MMKRILASLLAGLIVLVLAWLAGYDFNERGSKAFTCGIVVLMAIGMVYSYPGWKEK